MGTLKSIAIPAPYFGLAGTCEGMLTALSGGAMEKHAFMIITATRMALALIPTAVAIPVAALATYSYNFLRTRIDLFGGNIFEEGQKGSRHFRGACGLPPTKRFSQLPSFGLIAAPALTVAVMGYMTFGSFHTSKGVYVGLAPARCKYDTVDQLIVLHINSAGELFLNHEPQNWNTLAGRLSEIYSPRKYRTLYLLADSGVPFQKVAHALDLLESAPVMAGSQVGGMKMDGLNISVQLVTPTTTKHTQHTTSSALQALGYR